MLNLRDQNRIRADPAATSTTTTGGAGGGAGVRPRAGDIEIILMIMIMMNMIMIEGGTGGGGTGHHHLRGGAGATTTATTTTMTGPLRREGGETVLLLHRLGGTEGGRDRLHRGDSTRRATRTVNKQSKQAISYTKIK